MAEPLLSPTQKKTIGSIIDRCRRIEPRLRLLREMGRASESDEARIQQIIQSCEGALALDEAARNG